MTQNEIDALKKYLRKANRATHSYWIQIILLIFFKRDCLKKRRHLALLYPIIRTTKSHQKKAAELLPSGNMKNPIIGFCKVINIW